MSNKPLIYKLGVPQWILKKYIKHKKMIYMGDLYVQTKLSSKDRLMYFAVSILYTCVLSCDKFINSSVFNIKNIKKSQLSDILMPIRKRVYEN